MQEWIECSACSVEFKVLSDTDEPVGFCPYCAEPVEFELEDYDEDVEYG